MNSQDFLSAPNARKFNTTHWSVVTLAGKAQSPQSALAIEKAVPHLLATVVWVFIRRKGYSNADAEDLTQEFFARFLERNEFEVVDPSKGKFRTFLLAALTHFLSNQRDREQRGQTRWRSTDHFA